MHTNKKTVEGAKAMSSFVQNRVQNAIKNAKPENILAIGLSCLKILVNMSDKQGEKKEFKEHSIEQVNKL